jgi:phosphinothricin acetyltransferase
MGRVIRSADRSDAPALRDIYNQGICERQATFETRAREVGEIEAWFDEGLPIVVETGADGAVRGFARLNLFSDRCVYAGVGDHAIYVDRAARGQGVGRRLLEALCEVAAELGFYKITSRVFATNAASRAMHRAAGFREVGVQERHGKLDGEWRDMVLVERLIGEAAEAATRRGGASTPASA